MGDLDELDRLHAAATAGEWESVLCDKPGVDHDEVRMVEGPVARANGKKFVPVISRVSPRADADFIAAVHNAWPAISARLRAAEAENAKLRQHYDAAAPEHNLLAVLDMYEGRRLEAVAEVERLRGALREVVIDTDATGCSLDVALDVIRIKARAALGEP